MIEHETTSYRVKFSGGDPDIRLAGIVDRPKVWREADPASPRPVAIFSHCFTCNKDLKATVQISRSLAKSGIGVLRYDMTGLGSSEGRFQDTNFTTNLADLAAAIQFATVELSPVTMLVGHSFGGIASLVTAANAAGVNRSSNVGKPTPLSSLRFVATLAAPSDSKHLATLLSRMNPGIESTGAGAVTIGGVNWTITQQMLDDFRKHDVTSVLSRIRCPVLLMHSPVDETVGFDHAIRLMSLIQTDRSDSTTAVAPVSLVSLPSADHLLTKDPGDLVFVSEILAAWSRRYYPSQARVMRMSS